LRPPKFGEKSQQLSRLCRAGAIMNRENVGFPPFSGFGTLPANLSGMADGSSGRPNSGRHKMTFNLSSLQHIAVSAIGAIFTATLFITAAVGPAGQII
jgi:hypothetical protein